MVWSEAETAERRKELDESDWRTERSAERQHEVEEWLRVRAILVNAVSVTKGALGRMVTWKNGWTAGSVGNDGGGLANLSEMSFKNAIAALVEQVYEIEHETSRLYREGDFKKWDGQMWYNGSIDVKDARWVAVRWGIQKALLAIGFYVDLWRSLHPGVPGEWGLYEEGMTELGSLVFVEKTQEEATPTNEPESTQLVVNIQDGGAGQTERIQELLGALRRL